MSFQIGRENDISLFELLGNPDFAPWQKYFFEVSEGTMQIDFIDLKNLVEDTNYEKVHIFTVTSKLKHEINVIIFFLSFPFPAVERIPDDKTRTGVLCKTLVKKL